MKWILNLDRRTPNYILQEETKMKELRMQAIKRAIRYEGKAYNSKKKIIKECIRDLQKDRPKKEEGGWERKRREMIEKSGRRKEQLRNEREAGNRRMDEYILERIYREEKEERHKKIDEFRYNNNYKKIITEEIPKYLEGKKKRKDRGIIARYRCGNETRGSQYWREEDDRRCRICKRAEESMSHILRECEETKSEITIEFIGEEGKGNRIDEKDRENKRRSRKGK